MRIYITGGTGLVGSNIIRLAQEQYGAEIIASQFGPDPEWSRQYTLDPLDMRDAGAVQQAIARYQPDVVIHCAALLDQQKIHNQRGWAWQVMVDGTRAFAHACRQHNARFVFVSSDWVFDGRDKDPADEDTPPYPCNFYGVMKMASERELAVMDDLNYAVARLAGVYGLNYAIPAHTRWQQSLGFGDIVNEHVRQITRDEDVQVWTGPNLNEEAHPTLAADGAEQILRLAQHHPTGIFHCFGSESISRQGLAEVVVDVFDGDPARIQQIPVPAEVQEAYQHIPIPYRTRATVDQTAATLGRRSYTVREGVAAFKMDWEQADFDIQF